MEVMNQVEVRGNEEKKFPRSRIIFVSIHYRDLGLFSTLSMAREFISDYAVTISRDRIVVQELAGKSAFFSHVRNGLFKN